MAASGRQRTVCLRRLVRKSRRSAAAGGYVCYRPIADTSYDREKVGNVCPFPTLVQASAFETLWTLSHQKRSVIEQGIEALSALRGMGTIDGELHRPKRIAALVEARHGTNVPDLTSDIQACLSLELRVGLSAAHFPSDTNCGLRIRHRKIRRESLTCENQRKRS
jgi:hypothetical protein